MMHNDKTQLLGFQQARGAGSAVLSLIFLSSIIVSLRHIQSARKITSVKEATANTGECWLLLFWHFIVL
jgi:hypothetical protein